MIDKLKVGEYSCEVFEKGKNETAIEGLKDGDVYWTIKLDTEGYLDVERQEDAVMISLLVQIKNELRKLK